MYVRSPATPAPGLRAIRVTIDTPSNSAAWPRLSPDGRLVVYGTVTDGRPVLWVRPLDSDQGRALAGTTALESPFWSPDSRLLAFFADGRLKTIDIDSGRIETLTDVGRPRGGDWNKEGIILFCSDTGIDRMQPDGSRRQHVTELDRARGEYQHGWPQFLPDGRRFLYVVRSNVEEQAGVYLGSLDSKTTTRLMPAYSRIVYAPSGHLLYVRHGTLMAQSFDARAGRIAGEPKALAGPIKYHNGNDAAFDVSDNGVLIYRLDEGLAVHTARVDGSARAGTPDDRGCRLLQTAAVLTGHGTRGRRAIGAASRPTRTSGSTTSPIAARRG